MTTTLPATTQSALPKIPTLAAGVNPQALAEQFQRNALLGGHAALPGGNGKQFAKFDGNTGALTVGKAKVAMPAGQRLIVVVNEMKHGWIYWQGGKSEKTTEKMVEGWLPFPEKPDSRPLVGEMAKPYDRDGWQPTFVSSFIGLEGTFNGMAVELPGSSYSLQQFWTGLISEIVKRISEGHATTFPIITTRTDSYQNETYRRTVFTLHYDLVGWTDGQRIDPVDAAPAVATDAAGDIDVLS